jgi:hypothetical protein
MPPAGPSHRAEDQHPLQLGKRDRLVLGAVGERAVGDLVPEREPAGTAPVERFDERERAQLSQRLDFIAGPLIHAKAHALLLQSSRSQFHLPAIKGEAPSGPLAEADRPHRLPVRVIVNAAEPERPVEAGCPGVVERLGSSPGPAAILAAQIRQRTVTQTRPNARFDDRIALLKRRIPDPASSRFAR